MGYVTAAAFPVLPGQEDRMRNYKQEIAPFMEEFERLNKEGTFNRFDLFLQETPMGNFALYVFDVDDPSKIRQSFTDSAYDTWYLDFCRDVHGVDIRNLNPPPPPPPLVFEWKGE